MASIEERRDNDGNTVYRVKIRMKGQPTQSATFYRKTDAKKWAQDTESAIREGRHFQYAIAKRKTLNDVIDRYIEEVLPRKPKSYNDQKQQLDYWKRALGEYPLAEITPAMISNEREGLAKGKTTRGTRSKATVNRYLAALSHAYSIAVKEWNWAKENPVSRVSRLSEGQGRVRFLSDDERRRLLQACRESDNPFLYMVVVLALSTGARRNEILRLTWGDVDLERQVIMLQETKNGERRVLPLQGHAYELISDLARKRNDRSGYLFPSERTDKPMDIRKSWENALHEAEIENFRFHDLRHSAASYLAMNGASLNDIAEILGHKTLAMVKRYAHLSEAHTRDVVKSMNDKVFGDE